MKDFPLIRSGKAAVIGALLLAVPVILLSLTPFTGVYALLLIVFLMPMGCCTAAAVGGVAAGLAGLIASLYSAFHLLGLQGLIGCSIYLVPIFLIFLFLMGQKPAFFKGCALLIATHILAFGCLYLFAQQQADHLLYQKTADAAVQALSEMPECDMLLLQLYQSGFITLPSSLEDQLRLMPNGLYFITPAARQDLLLSVGSMIENLLISLVVLVMTQHSIVSGVACLLLPLRFGKLHHEKLSFLAPEGTEIAPFPDLAMPPLSLWHLPRGMGWKVGLAWVMGSFLQAMGGSHAVSMAGTILYYAATAVFTWQGAALMNFTQKARGTKRPFRVMIPLLFYALGILPYMGIFDQIINLRGLRKPPEPKEEI